MTAPYYTKARARRSLGHFLVGKLLSALAGLAWLLWLVRQAEPVHYGAYVAALALVEVFYLVSGMGLSTLAQRYVAEWRIAAAPAQFRRFVWGLMARRALYALLGAGLLALGLAPLLGSLGLSLSTEGQVALLVWLVAGSLTRQLDEIFPALMLQAASQLQSLGANLLRLGSAAIWMAEGLAPTADRLLHMEAMLACLLALAGLLWLWWAALRPSPQEVRPDGPVALAHHNPARDRVARRLYAVQLLGQAWSGNAARLLVTHGAGAAQAALLGFAASLADTLRNYLPAYLLANWVRPLMVARWRQGRDMAPLALMANALLKLSWLPLAPLLAYFGLRGDEFAAWLSGGRYGAGMGLLLALLMLWLALLCAHLLLSVVTATVEHTGANLQATAFGLAFLPLAAWAALHHGPVAVVALLAAFEALWVLWVGRALRRAALPCRWDRRGLLVLGLAGLLAAVPAALLPPLAGPWTLLALLAASLVSLLVCVVMKPLHEGERELLATVLPRRFLWI